MNERHPNGDTTYRPGTRVRVRSSLGRWSRGFVVTAFLAGRYQLRRESDGTVLPAEVGPNKVRLED
jgi:hypothetical protein